MENELRLLHRLAEPWKVPPPRPAMSAEKSRDENAERFETIGQISQKKLDEILAERPSLFENLGAELGNANVWARYASAIALLFVRLKNQMIITEREVVQNGNIFDELFKLSLQAQKSIRILLEYVVWWGLVPNLTPGVGRPFTRKPPKYDDISSLYPPGMAPNVQVLSICAMAIAEMCEEEELGMTIADSHLIDEIAALIEIASSPTHTNLQLETRKRSHHLLETLFQPGGLPTLNLSRAVIYLLTSSFAKQKMLKVDLAWLRDVCSQLLASLLTGSRPDGLHALLSIFVDQPNVEDAAFFKAAQLITSVPKHVDPDQYFARLAPQILDELRSRGQNTDNHLRAASIIVAVMLERYPDFAFRHLILPISAPFRTYVELCAHNLSESQKRREKALHERQQQGDRSNPALLDVKSPASIQLSLADNHPLPMKKKVLIEEVAPVSSQSELQSMPAPQPTATSLPPAKASSQDALTSLLKPFKYSSKDFESLSADTVACTVADIHTLVLHNPNPALLEKLMPLIPCLFEIFTLQASSSEADLLTEDTAPENQQQSASEVITKAKEILLLFFAFVSRSLSVRTLMYLIFENDKDWNALYPGKAFRFELLADQASVQLRNLSINQDDEFFVRDALNESASLLDILKSLAAAATTTQPNQQQQQKTENATAPDLLGDLFIQLLVEFVALHDENVTSQSLRSGERAMVALQVLLGMSESLGENILANVVQVCLFVQSMLKSDDEEIQSLSMTILDMLTQSTSKVKITDAEVDILLVEMLNPLKLISMENNNDAMRAFASRLHSRIKDMIASVSAKRNAKQEPEPLFNPSAKQAVEEPHAASVEEAIADIASPIAPIRAGGLIQLRRFLLQQNKDAIARLPSILKLFGDNLSNDESYVYLGAIQGLSAVGDVALSLTLPYIKQHYSDTKQKLEVRLNIGEAIMQIAQRLGEALAKYSDSIYGLISGVLRDPDTTMRASALSNIAELGELLGYGIKPYIQEIMDVIYDIVLIEKEVEVRRAAINAIYQIVHGLDQRVFHVIPEHLNRLKELLNVLSTSDADEITRFLANMAADEIKETEIQRVQNAANLLSGGELEDKLRFIKPL